MKKKDMLSALGKTVKDEEVAVKTKKGRLQNRFYKAKEVLDEDKITTPVETPTDRKYKRKRVIADTFTMPPRDYDLIEKIMDKFLDGKKKVHKSEVVRIALRVLDGLPQEKLLNTFEMIEKVKVGRPK